MNLQTEIVPELSQEWLHGTWLKAHNQDLVVDSEEDKVYLFILNCQVTQGSALRLKLGECIENERWDATHELPIISFRGKAVDRGSHP